MRIAFASHRLLTMVLTYCLLSQWVLSCYAQSGNASATGNQNKQPDIVISVGKPSIWTLAQAHYLLAQVHDSNRQLQVAPLGALDPNSINRQRIEVLRTMLGVTAEYDDLTGLKNELTKQRYETITARRRDVKSMTDYRRNELYQVTRELTLLQTEIGQLQAAEKPDAALIKAKEEEKKAKEAERDVLKEQITALDAEATALSADAGATIPTFASPSLGGDAQAAQPTSPLASLIDKSTIDSLLKEAAKGSSQLDASRRLDNHIQMQYELIAKQLTLLRDEVGRDERVIFLELPSSIYTVPKKSDRRVVQVRWQVTHYLEQDPASRVPVSPLCVPSESAAAPGSGVASVTTGASTSRTSEAILASQHGVRTIKQNSLDIDQAVSASITSQAAGVEPKQAPAVPADLKAQPLSDEKRTLVRLYWTDASAKDRESPASHFVIMRRSESEAEFTLLETVAAGQTQYDDTKVEPQKKYFYRVQARNSKGDSALPPYISVKTLPLEAWETVGTHSPAARAIDIIPRQSALNVNQTYDTSNGLNIAAKFAAFAGFGGKVDYQRQREVYDQFIYQDVFASGYGKGESRFGWTFGALPGSKRIAPGVRTTYAVLAVPAKAKKLRLKAWGYAFDQNKPQPEWASVTDESLQTIDLDIPQDDIDGFDLTGVDYIPVKSGDRVSMVLNGNYFSPQLGMLVNGMPLRRVVSISQNQATQNIGANGISGEFEYVGSRKVIATFTLGAGYEGTPVITLVTPERTSDINRLDINVNHNSQTCNSIELHSMLEPMFSQPLSLESAQLVAVGTDDKKTVTVNLWGKGFRSKPIVSVNGRTIRETVSTGETLGSDEVAGMIKLNSTRQLVVQFPKPPEPSWEFMVRQNNKQGMEQTAVPLRMSRPLTRQVSYEILRYRPKEARKLAELAVKLDVSTFSGKPTVQIVEGGGPVAFPGREVELSPGELLLTMQPEQDLRLEPIILLLTQGEVRSLVSIMPPVPPTISGIENESAQNKAEGLMEGEYPVIIRGENLEYVARVYFGSNPARILQVSPNALTIMVPKGAEGPVQVRLETNIKYLDRLLTNIGDFAISNNRKIVFTYVKPAPPPKP